MKRLKFKSLISFFVLISQCNKHICLSFSLLQHKNNHVHRDRNQIKLNNCERLIRLMKSSRNDYNTESTDHSLSDDEDCEIHLDQVSDEEILLACRSYLQKRNKLEWTNAKRRKQSAQMLEIRRHQHQGELNGFGAGGDVGYFWENTNELKYYNNAKQVNREYLFRDDSDEAITSELDVEDDKDESDEDENLNNFLSPELGDGFNTLPSNFEYPSQEHINRSIAAKKKWADPEFKKKWYAKRWGKQSPHNKTATDASTISKPSSEQEIEQLKQQQSYLKKVKIIPKSLLNSPLLSNMTEEQVQHAVTTYIRGNQKRSKSLKKRNQIQMKASSPYSALPNSNSNRFFHVHEKIEKANMLFEQSITEDSLREKQKIRSEHARKAYQTRIANESDRKERQRKRNQKNKSSMHKIAQADKSTSVSKKGSYAQSLSSIISSASTRDNKINVKKLQQKEAMIQIEKCLDNGELPSSVDLHFILSANRLTGRRPLLLRILNESFGLFGKCIPGDPSLGSESQMLFASKCNVDVLGSFLLEKLEENELADTNSL